MAKKKEMDTKEIIAEDVDIKKEKEVKKKPRVKKKTRLKKIDKKDKVIAEFEEKILRIQADFENFKRRSKTELEAALELNEMLLNYNGDLSSLNKISTIEHECDCIVHDTLNKLNRSFITPIDREDIDELIKELDTITDTIYDTVQALKMYNVKKLRKDITEFSFLTIQILEELQKLMNLLINMKNNTKKINYHVIKINDIENKGDALYVQVISELFKKEKDPIEVIKWKDIFLYLENTLDQCERVANIVEGVVIKHV